MNKEILRLAIPNILSNISIPLLSTVDTALMGHLSVHHLGAVGIGAMIFNFIYWNFGFLRMGTTGLTSQYYGQKNTSQISAILMRSVCISLLISVLLMGLYYPLSKFSLLAFNVIADQKPLVIDYFNIRIIAAPASLTLYVLMGWFFGMQNAISPLIITVFINVINLVLSYYFVVHLHLEIEGVAWGTVIAQYAGVILATFLLFSQYKEHTYSNISILKGKWDEWKKMFAINFNIFLRTVCLTFAFGFFYAQSSSEGALMLATNVVLLQFLSWMSYGIDGFAFASESIIGKYFGAKDGGAFFKAIKYSFIWALVVSIIYSLVFFFFGMSLASMFTDDLAVLALLNDTMILMSILPIIAFACYIWDGIYIGLTEAHLMLQTMILSLVFYLGYYYVSKWLGSASIWGAMILFLGIRGFLQTLYWYWHPKFKILKSSVY